MFVDPEVSKVKFHREIAAFRKLNSVYQTRGIYLVDATFPIAFALIVAKNAKPAPVVPFAVNIDFSNYDVEPPSVQLVNPFTREKLKRSEILYDFRRQLPTIVGQPQVQQVPLLQSFVDERPFICLQGVKEYHDSPAHTGDSWFLHRGRGPGTLAFVLDVLSRYGADPIIGPAINIHLQVNGFAVSAIPT